MGILCGRGQGRARRLDVGLPLALGTLWRRWLPLGIQDDPVVFPFTLGGWWGMVILLTISEAGVASRILMAEGSGLGAAVCGLALGGFCLPSLGQSRGSVLKQQTSKYGIGLVLGLGGWGNDLRGELLPVLKNNNQCENSVKGQYCEIHSKTRKSKILRPCPGCAPPDSRRRAPQS